MILSKKVKHEVIESRTPYRVSTECELKLNGQVMDEADEFKYLSSFLRNHESMEGEIRENITRDESSGILWMCNERYNSVHAIQGTTRVTLSVSERSYQRCLYDE